MADTKIEPRIVCPCCNGSGKGYVGLQDADPCEKCNGETTIPNPAATITPVPHIDEDFEYCGFLLHTTQQAIKSRMHPTLNKVRVDSIRERTIQTLKPDWVCKVMDSVASHGLVCPVQVRRIENYYELIDGAYRVAAARRLRLEEIDAMVRRCTEHEEWNFRRILESDREGRLTVADLTLLADSGIRPIEYQNGRGCFNAPVFYRWDKP